MLGFSQALTLISPPQPLIFLPSLNPNVRLTLISQGCMETNSLLCRNGQLVSYSNLQQQIQNKLLVHLSHSLHQCSNHLLLLLELLLAPSGSEMKQLAKPAIKAQEMEGKAFQSAVVHAAEWIHPG